MQRGACLFVKGLSVMRAKGRRASAHGILFSLSILENSWLVDFSALIVVEKIPT